MVVKTRKVIFVIALVLLTAKTAHCQNNPIKVHIKSDKEIYESGEAIAVDVDIQNTSDKDFWIAKPQPGSEIKARFPYCVFEVKNFEGKLMNENHAYYTQRLK